MLRTTTPETPAVPDSEASIDAFALLADRGAVVGTGNGVWTVAAPTRLPARTAAA